MDVSVLREHSSWRRCRSVVVTGDTDLPQEFDVVCLGAGVAGEAIAVGLRDSGLTLIGAVLVTPRAGEIVGVLALRIPLKTLADVIDPFPALNRVLGRSLHELAAKASNKAPHDPDVMHHNQWRSQ
jgi:2-polyprenyl-6-methoxyphenol hydroxylase-like FAD-dependent oxidoreductase